MTKRLVAKALLAAGAVLATAGSALAVQIVMMANANVYATPDLNSAPIGAIAQGTVAEASQCASGWCFVDQPAGADGWVSASAIDTVANQTGPGKMFPGNPQPQPPQPPPPQQPGGSFPLPNFSFGFNFGGNNPPPRFDGVCFYTGTSFRGRSFCAEPGDAANRLPSSFNDAISSIEVFGDAEVDVCTDRNMRGTCMTIRRDTARLSSRVNDRISSFEVF